MEPVLGLSTDRNQVVLPQRGEGAVKGDGRLGRNVVRDAANGTPNSLRPIARVTNDLALGNAIAVERLTTEETATRKGGVLVHGIHEQRAVRAVLLAQQQRLGNAIQRKAGQLLAVPDELTKAAHDAVIGARVKASGLRGGVEVVIHAEGRGSAVQSGGIERDSERLSDLLTEQGHIVAGVRANDLSRDHGDSRDLVGLDRLQRETARGGRLLASLRNPRRGRLRGDVGKLLPVDTQRDTTGKGLDDGRPSGLLEIILSLGRLKEASKLAGLSCSSLSHRYLLESMGDQTIPRAFFSADSMPSPLRASAGAPPSAGTTYPGF